MPFLFSPIGVRLMIALAVLAGLAAVAWEIREDGKRDALIAVERANTEAQRRADEGGRTVLTCPPELWSRELRRCATKLP